jgi:hypothetical protein
MNENEMGYRGSKSVLVYSSVKEQRVDGSYLKNKNFKVKIYSNGLRK